MSPQTVPSTSNLTPYLLTIREVTTMDNAYCEFRHRGVNVSNLIRQSHHIYTMNLLGIGKYAPLFLVSL